MNNDPKRHLRAPHDAASARRRTLAAAAALVASAPALIAMPGAFAQSAANRSADGLVEAANRGDLARVRALVAAGAKLETRDAQGRTALLAATQDNRIDVAKFLIASGADVNAKDQIQDSPYLLAGARGYLEILRATLAAGADLKSTNRYGGTALIPASHYGHVETVRELLKTKIDIDHVNRLGWTALLEAVILGDGGARHTEIVRLLIGHKANVNLPDTQGELPLAHARSRGFRDIARLLEAAGARAEARSARGETAPDADARAAGQRWIEQAFVMKSRAEAAGDQPFGAVLVLDGRVVGEGPSRVVTKRDDDAHAEREAIRDAQRRLGRERLDGAVLYSTSRPCSRCETAAARARIGRMIHGREMNDAGTPRS